MSTDFMLYALDEADLELARRYMGTSLGYGTSIYAVVNNAARAQSGDAKRQHDLSGYDVFERSSFTIDDDHVSLHGGEVKCFAHDLVALIGHDLPLLDMRLRQAIIDAIPPRWTEGIIYTGHETKPPYKYRKATHHEAKAALTGWLEGARGRHLWYAFV